MNKQIERATIRQQAGMTALGMIIIAILVGTIGYAGLTLMPVYLKYQRVVSILHGVRDEFDGNDPNPTVIRKSITRRMIVESLDSLKLADFKITRQGEGYLVNVEYDETASFVGNVSFLVAFNKQVEIRR